MLIQRVAVIGAGTMGRGIAQLFAQSGYRTTLIDKDPEALRKAMGRIKDAARVASSERIADASGAEFVVEAIVEDLGAKRALFTELERACMPETVLASNTSSLPISKIAEGLRRQDRVIGMHFMNPAPVMKLVEIIPADETSETAFETTRSVAIALGKTPVVSRDAPGFIANRILMPMINEACWALHEKVASAEDIDTVMKLGMGHPMGPLALADFIGLDICLAILETLHRQLGDEKYRPCPLLVEKVGSGALGKKSGQGFYRYGANAPNAR